jgi:hypothetical protein
MSLTRQAFELVKLNKCGAKLGLELFVFLHGLDIPAPGIKVRYVSNMGQGSLRSNVLRRPFSGLTGAGWRRGVP